MIRVDVLIEDRLAGWVTHDPKTNRFAFDYAPEWLAHRDRYSLSPQIPLTLVSAHAARPRFLAVFPHSAINNIGRVNKPNYREPLI